MSKRDIIDGEQRKTSSAIIEALYKQLKKEVFYNKYLAGILLAGFTAYAVALRAMLRTCEAPAEQSALASLQASLQIRFA